MLIFVVFQVYRKAVAVEFPQFYSVMLISFFYSFAPFVHFSILQFSQKASFYFSVVQIPLVIFLSLEVTIHAGGAFVTVDGFNIVMIMMTSLCLKTYCQRNVLITMFIVFIYTITRTYSWINDPFRYYKFNLY